MKKQIIIEYDDDIQTIKKSKGLMGDLVISVSRKFYRCASCGCKVNKKNWGGHILKPKYRNKKYALIFKQDQKDFVCNVCLRPDVRATMRALGLGNRK